VSERDLREIFPTFEDCYCSAYEHGLDRLSRTVTAAAGREAGWLERVRSGLVALLGFCDDHPSWARLLVFEGSVSAGVTLECRQRLYDVLARLLDHHQPAGVSVPSPLPTPVLTCELIVGGVFSVIHTSMLSGDDGKLVDLAPSLMAFIVTPYLGQAAAQAELEGRSCEGVESSLSQPERRRVRTMSPAAGLPVRATHRTTLVLRAIACAPYSNNREIAQAAELVDEGQASKLLARLERKGVIENVGVGAVRGEPNAWLLTASGRRTVELLVGSFESDVPRPRSTAAKRLA
jgi:hypothetical protein